MYENERELQVDLKNYLNTAGYIAVVDRLDYFDVIGVKCPKSLLKYRFDITGFNNLVCGFFGHSTIKDVYYGLKENLSVSEISKKLNLAWTSTMYRINWLLKCNLVKKIGENKYEVINPFISFEDYEAVYIEAKLINWKKGINQCISGKAAFDKVYLGVPYSKVHLVINFEELSEHGIGLIGVGDENEIILEAKFNEMANKELKRLQLEYHWYEESLIELGYIPRAHHP